MHITMKHFWPSLVVFLTKNLKTGKLLKLCCFLKRMSTTAKEFERNCKNQNMKTMSFQNNPVNFKAFFIARRKTKGKMRVETWKLDVCSVDL